MKMKSFTLCMSITSALLTGCASQPSISQFRQTTGKVAFVENGSQPLNYTTGVVDTASFWAQNGNGIGANLGGSLLASAAATAGREATMSKEEQNREMVKKLYGDSTLATSVNDTLLSKLAIAWNTPINPAAIVKVPTEKPVIVDPNTKIAHGLSIDADLVLVTEVHNINLTERASAGGILAAGFTMGTNKKSLTTEVMVVLRALKHEPTSGQYKEIWFTTCGTNYALMKTSYYLEDLAQDPSKMQAILDEATTQTIDYCSRAINAAAKS